MAIGPSPTDRAMYRSRLLAALMMTWAMSSRAEDPARWSVLVPSSPNLTPSLYRAPHAFDASTGRFIVVQGSAAYALSSGPSPSCTRLRVSGSPPSRDAAAVGAHDSRRNRLIVFSIGPSFAAVPYAQSVSALSLATPHLWTRLQPTGTPPPLTELPAVAYDATRDRMLLFGGASGSNRLWELRFSPTPVWAELTPAGSWPAERGGAAIVVDSRRDRLLLFGGISSQPWPVGSRFNDTWQLPLSDGGAWDSLTVGAARPEGRYQTDAVYDSVADRLMLFGGSNLSSPGGLFNGLWSLDLAGAPQWSRASVVTEPSPRIAPLLARDPVGGRTLLFGGVADAPHAGASREFWTLADGDTAWRRVAPVVPPDAPDGTYYPSVALDGGRLVTISGYGPTPAPYSGALHAANLTIGTWSEVGGGGGGFGPCLFDLAGRKVLRFGAVFAFPIERQGTLFERPLDSPGAWSGPLNIAGVLPDFHNGAQYVFREATNEWLMYGGVTNPVSGHQQYLRFDVWAFSIAQHTWREVARDSLGFGLAYGPIGQIVFDAPRDRLLLVPYFGGAMHALPLDGSADAWQPLPWIVRPLDMATPSTIGNYRALGSAMIHFDPLRDRLVTMSEGDSVWVLPLFPPGSDWQALPTTGDSPNGEALLAAFDATQDRAIAFGGSLSSNGVWALTFDHATPTALAAASATVSDAGVALEWRGDVDASFVAAVERGASAEEWSSIATIAPDGDGALRYLDSDAPAGRIVGYRLAWSDAGVARRTAPTWVETPRSPGVALERVWPNPATSDAELTFTLADRGPAKLELFDASGRRVVVRDVSALGAGRHTLRLTELATTPPGVFFARLVARGVSKQMRFALVR